MLAFFLFCRGKQVTCSFQKRCCACYPLSIDICPGIEQQLHCILVQVGCGHKQKSIYLLGCLGRPHIQHTLERRVPSHHRRCLAGHRIRLTSFIQ